MGTNHLDRGISRFRNKFRVAAVASLNKRRKRTDKVFPADTSRRAMQAWREAEVTRLRAEIQQEIEQEESAAKEAAEEKDSNPEPLNDLLTSVVQVSRDYTLEQAARVYLQLVHNMPDIKGRTRELQHWMPWLRHWKLADITPPAIRTIIGEWQRPTRCYHCASSAHVRRETEGALFCTDCEMRVVPLANDTINKRRTALNHLYNQLFGRSKENPVRDVRKLPPKPPQPRGQRMEYVRRALAAMPHCKSKARCAVLAFTAIRPVSLRRLAKEDVHLDDRVIHAEVLKGGRWKKYPCRLNDDAVAAMKMFMELDAWGTFTSAPLNRAWHRACKRAGVPDMKVYDLRHSLATEMRRQKQPLENIKEQLGHSTLSLTERYAWVDNELVQQAVDSVDSGGSDSWITPQYDHAKATSKGKHADGLDEGARKMRSAGRAVDPGDTDQKQNPLAERRDRLRLVHRSESPR